WDTKPEAHQEDVPTPSNDTQNVFLCRRSCALMPMSRCHRCDGRCTEHQDRPACRTITGLAERRAGIVVLTEGADTSVLSGPLACRSELETCDDRINRLWPAARRICPLRARLVRVTLRARLRIDRRGPRYPCVEQQGQSLLATVRASTQSSPAPRDAP